jgi:MYXO-CTERM domain-containing protein
LRCHAAAVSCVADSDCTGDWTCAEIGATGGCAKSPAPEPNSNGGAQGGEIPPPDCQPSAIIKQCMPPYYELARGVNGVDRDYAGTPTSGTDASSGSADVPPTAESGTDESTANAGCSVGHGSGTASTGLALLGALGLFGALRRRRAH